MMMRRDISELKLFLEKQIQDLKDDIGRCKNDKAKMWIEGRLSGIEMVAFLFVGYKTDELIKIENKMQELCSMTDKEKKVADDFLPGKMNM